jgi:lysozyme
MSQLPKPLPTSSKRPARRTLATILGAAAAAALLQFVPTQEGTVYKTYKDIGGVLTYCTGATEDAIAGKVYTPAECSARLDYDLAVHAEGVMSCIKVPLTVGQKVAFVDTAYNIGIAGFCNSSMARKTNAGDRVGGCQALKLWVKVQGKVVRGLVLRRERVMAYCLKD